jgi:hypothetical protein
LLSTEIISININKLPKRNRPDFLSPLNEKMFKIPQSLTSINPKSGGAFTNVLREKNYYIILLKFNAEYYF